jgi:hypothetical protein
MAKPLSFDDMQDIDNRFWAVIEQERRWHRQFERDRKANSGYTRLKGHQSQGDKQ